MTIFRTPEGKAKMLAWHEKFRADIGRPTASRTLPTRFGSTHALLCGPEDAPPLILIHGAMASSAHALREVAPLADRFRIIALDVIGQSPLSAEVRPDPNGSAYGEWARDCLDALDVVTARVLGVSWGGMAALRLAAFAPERITKMSLLVPAGLVQGPGGEAFRKMLLPMALYRAFPTQARLERLLSNLFTTMDPNWVAYMGDAFRHCRLDFRSPRLLRDDELASFHSPVQVVAAERDLSFPGAALLARAKEVFPRFLCGILLPSARHVPSFESEARRELTESIAAFIQ